MDELIGNFWDIKKQIYHLNEKCDLKMITLSQITHIFVYKTPKSTLQLKSGDVDRTIFFEVAKIVKF
jgi:hypothetical protein